MKNIIQLIIIIVLITITSCTKTEPGIDQKEQFVKIFGSAYADKAVDILQIENNYFILANIASKNNQNHVLLVKTDQYGNKLNEYNFATGLNTEASQILLSQNNQNLIIVGTQTTDNNLYYNDIYLLVTNFDGDLITEQTIAYKGHEYGKGIAQTTNGFIIIADSAAINNTLVTKRLVVTTDNLGNVINTFAGKWSKSESVKNIIALSDGRFAVVGESKNHPDATLSQGVPFISVRAANGSEEVYFHYNIAGVFNKITANTDGSLFVTGTAYKGDNGNYDAFCALINTNNDQFNWIKHIGTGYNDEGFDIKIGTTGNIILCGNTYNNLGKSNIMVVKCNIDGTIITNKNLGGGDNEYGVAIIESEQQFIALSTNYKNENAMVCVTKHNF